jgi:hypothetical protein
MTIMLAQQIAVLVTNAHMLLYPIVNHVHLSLNVMIIMDAQQTVAQEADV